MIAAFAAGTIFLSGLPTARAAGEADAFTPEPQHQSRPIHRSGFFSSKSSNDGSGPGKPNGNDSNGDDGGIPKYPKRQSIQETRQHLNFINQQINKLEEVTDSDSEIECESAEQSQESESFTDEQNKAGIDELPNSSKFVYKLETKTAKKTLQKVWKNPKAKKEVLAGLDRMNKGELLPRNQKPFKGFKTLKEIKLTDTRILVQPGQNGGPDQIVAIFMRRDLDYIASIFKDKYK
jgi:hypothetical protein